MTVMGTAPIGSSLKELTHRSGKHRAIHLQVALDHAREGKALRVATHRGAIKRAKSRNGIHGFDFRCDKEAAYLPIPITEQTECLSLNGTIGVVEMGEPMLHLHCTLGYPDGSMQGGHMLKAVVRPTLEVFLTEADVELPKVKDPASGLELFTFEN